MPLMAFMETKGGIEKLKSPKPTTTESTIKIISPTSPMITHPWIIPKNMPSLTLTTTAVIIVMAVFKSIPKPHGEIALVKQKFILSTPILGDILISIGASTIPFMTTFGVTALSSTVVFIDHIGD